MNRRDVCTGIAAGIGQSLLFSGSGAAMAAGLKTGSGDIARLTIAAASKVIHAGELSCVDVANACLARIDAANPRINAVITTMRAQALAQAAQLDDEAKAGKFRSPLHGIPVALKDNIPQ